MKRLRILLETWMTQLEFEHAERELQLINHKY